MTVPDRLASPQNFRILGSGLHLPQDVLHAQEVDRRCGTEIGWTQKHTQIETRYECTAPETLGSMASSAIRSALTEAQVSLTDIDALIDCSTCRHQVIPCNSVMVQAELGEEAQGIPCFDVNSTCLGFVIGMHVANGLMASENYRRVIVFCSEAGLAGVNWQQPTSAALISDGAAAVVLERSMTDQVIRFCHQTFSDFKHACQILGGGNDLPFFEHQGKDDPRFRFDMQSKEIVRAAFRYLPPMFQSLQAEEGEESDHWHCIPHQASPRGLEMVRRLLGFPKERFHNYCCEMGNMISVSIPATLHRVRCEKQIQSGDRILLLGTSAGYSQAGLAFTL